MSFKGNKVWVATDNGGDYTLEKGKVRMKYNLMHDQEYWIEKESLKDESEAIPAGKERNRADLKATLEKLPPHCIKIFVGTIPPKTQGEFGIGLLFQYRNHEKKINGRIKAKIKAIAELSALEMALKELKRRDLPVKIFTTSQNNADVLNNKPLKHKNPIVQEQWDQLQKIITRFSDIQCIRIKPDTRIKETRVADYLAASAQEDPAP